MLEECIYGFMTGGKMGIADVLILLLVGVWLLGVVVYLGKKKKNGGCIGCSGGGCADCPKERKNK